MKDKARNARYTERFLEAYSVEGSIRTVDPTGATKSSTSIGARLIYNEYGLFNAHSSVMRDCLSDVIRQTAGLRGFDKVDNAQMIQIERIFIAKMVPGFHGIDRGSEEDLDDRSDVRRRPHHR